MPTSLAYRKANLTLSREGGGTRHQIKELQRDLRRLGYLRTGIDGVFGSATERAVKALQFDLMSNDGRGVDGSSEVSMIDFNKSRIVRVDGIVTQADGVPSGGMIFVTRPSASYCLSVQ